MERMKISKKEVKENDREYFFGENEVNKNYGENTLSIPNFSQIFILHFLNFLFSLFYTSFFDFLFFPTFSMHPFS